MAKAEETSKSPEEALKEAKLKYVWAPLITALVPLVAAGALHMSTSGKLGDASTNFQKLSDAVQSLTDESKRTHDELDNLNNRVDDIISALIARGPVATPPVSMGERHPREHGEMGSASDAPKSTGAPAAPAGAGSLDKLQALKVEIGKSRARMNQFNLKPVPKALFEK